MQKIVGFLVKFSFTVSARDYDETPLLFDTCDTRKCVNIAIVDDETLENEEVFSFVLRSPDQDSRIMFDPAEGTIRILENDGIIIITVVPSKQTLFEPMQSLCPLEPKVHN